MVSLTETEPLSAPDQEAGTAAIIVWTMLLLAYVWPAGRALFWVVSQSGFGGQGAFIFLASVMALFLSVWRFGAPKIHLSFEALGLILGCAVLSVLSESLLHQLSAAFALLGFYGFTAGFKAMTPKLWRQGLVLAALAALALPFALVRGTGLGFYLRLMTADAAAFILGLLGHVSLGAHDVLIFDNGIAQVDAPCSGLKSLFTGTAFFLTASLLLRRGVSRKWLVSYGLFILLLLAANTLRVTLLIWTADIAGLRGLAETIHVPVGLVLFSACCLFGLWALRYCPAYQTGPVRRGHNSHVVISALTVSLLVVLSFASASPPERAFKPYLAAPPSMQVSQVPLTPAEEGFFGARDNTKARKWIFNYEGLSGSMLVVHSRAANGLHAPEVCMLGNGFTVDAMETRKDGASAYRWLTVDGERRNALYWMQSGTSVTDDFRTRLSRFLLRGERDWTMVTLLLDGRHDPDTIHVQTLRNTLITHYAKAPPYD